MGQTASWKFLNGGLMVLAVGTLGSIVLFGLRNTKQERRLEQPKGDQMSEVMHQGRTAFLSGDERTAEKKFLEVLTKRPKNPAAHLALAQLYKKQNLGRKALDEYVACVGDCLDKGSWPIGGVSTIACYGELARSLGQEERARTVFRGAAKIIVASAATPANAGRALMSTGAVPKDAARLSVLEGEVQWRLPALMAQALNGRMENPKLTRCMVHLAAGVQRQHAAGLPDPADHLRLAIQACPDHWLAQCGFSVWLAERGKSNEAKTLIARASSHANRKDATDLARWREIVDLLSRGIRLPEPVPPVLHP